MIQIEFTDLLHIEALRLIDSGPVIVADNSELDSIAERLDATITASNPDGSYLMPDEIVMAYEGMLEAFTYALDCTEFPRESGRIIHELISRF